MSVRLFGLLAAALLLGACPAPSPPSGAHAGVEGSSAVEAVEGSSSVPGSTAATAETARADQTDERPAPAAQPDADTPRPPNLAILMRSIGYTDASPASLDEFVHLPPGAEGEAGTFGSGTQTVRVALIGYPNRHYARPHVTDVAERNRVLPAPREAIAWNGRWVVHVAASDRETAEAVVRRVREALDWPEP